MVSNNGHSVRTQGGNCKTRNIVYGATCKLCTVNNVYVGKTVTSRSQRVNGRRSKYYEILEASSKGNVESHRVFDDENV